MKVQEVQDKALEGLRRFKTGSRQVQMQVQDRFEWSKTSMNLKLRLGAQEVGLSVRPSVRLYPTFWNVNKEALQLSWRFKKVQDKALGGLRRFKTGSRQVQMQVQDRFKCRFKTGSNGQKLPWILRSGSDCSYLSFWNVNNDSLLLFQMHNGHLL